MSITINGQTSPATEFAWDGCHKIYLLDNGDADKNGKYGYMLSNTGLSRVHPPLQAGGECHERRSRIQGAAGLGTTARMGPILPAPLHQQLGARQELCSPMLREARHHRSALKEKTMKSYKAYAEEYGLDIEVIRWVFNHIRVTRYVMSEPIGYKIAFKYLGQPVHLSSEWKTGVAEKSFREIVNIRRKAITTEANPELVPDKD